MTWDIIIFAIAYCGIWKRISSSQKAETVGGSAQTSNETGIQNRWENRWHALTNDGDDEEIDWAHKRTRENLRQASLGARLLLLFIGGNKLTSLEPTLGVAFSQVYVAVYLREHTFIDKKYADE